jgi:uncharacterized protein (TIGR00255 family)
MTLKSMTGFADRAGGLGQVAWVWDARSVNGRGLDVRVRLPEGCEGLEAPLRAAVGKAFARGSVSIGLRLIGGAEAGGLRLNEAALATAVVAAGAAAAVAAERGIALAPVSAGELLALRGVLEAEAAATGLPAEVLELLAADIAPLLAALGAARAAEGAGLAAVIAGQVERIAELTAAARATAEARAARTGALLRARVEALMAASGAVVDPGRQAQELAQIAVRVDLTEEIDRLEAHIASAREMIAGEEPVGRRLDFLSQEFNREANTLCSKAQASDLTAIGLEMKAVIDQMREQVQNVE